MKVKKIWSADTAWKVADAKAAKHGGEWAAVSLPGGGFEVVQNAAGATSAGAVDAGSDWAADSD